MFIICFPFAHDYIVDDVHFKTWHPWGAAIFPPLLIFHWEAGADILLDSGPIANATPFLHHTLARPDVFAGSAIASVPVTLKTAWEAFGVWGARMLMGVRTRCRRFGLLRWHPNTISILISLQCWQRCYVVWRHLLHQIFVNKDPAWGFLKNKTYDANPPTVCIWKKLWHTYLADLGCVYMDVWCCSLRTLCPFGPWIPLEQERLDISTVDIGHCWPRCYHMVSPQMLEILSY